MNSSTLFRSCALALVASPFAVAQVTETQELQGSQVLAGDRFGWGLSMSDTLVAIGAHRDDVVASDAGALYLFDRTVSPWQELAILRPPTSAAGYFGFASDIEGGVLVVGAPRDASGASSGGAVYVFTGSGGAWAHHSTIVPFNVQAGDQFGSQVSLVNDTLVVSSPYASPGGSVYVYENVQGVGWVLQQLLVSSTASAGDEFGRFIALHPSGSQLVVGALYDDQAGSDSGSAFVFTKVGSSWSETAHLLSSEASSGDEFGYSVAWLGDDILVGSINADSGGNNAGAVFQFKQQDGLWTEVGIHHAPSGVGNRVGASVAGHLDRLYAGDDLHASAAGDVHEFESVSGTWQHTGTLGSSSAQPGDQCAHHDCLAIEGTTLLAGAPFRAGHGSVLRFELAPPALPDVSLSCFCDSPALAPCGNDDYLAGCENVFGHGGRLFATGTTSTSLDDLVLTVDQIAPNQFGVVFMGASSTSLPFADGRICIAQGGGIAIYRYNPPISSGQFGSFSLGPGIVGLSQSFPPIARIAAGATWHFQAWYRDPLGPCGNGSNLTNVAEVTFTP